MDFDYGLEPTEQGESKDSLEQLGFLAKRAQELATDIANAEEFVKRLQKQYKQVVEVDIPDIMDACGTTEFHNRNLGIRITLEEKVTASIPTTPRDAAGWQRRNDALAWLRENGWGGIIKNEVVASFTKGEDELCQSALEALRSTGAEPSHREGVHAQTLGAWVRERLEEGDDIPFDLFGVNRLRTAKVKVETP